jgi:hypothetical protein
MFCVDYALSFIVHGFCTFGLVRVSSVLEKWGYFDVSRMAVGAAASFVGLDRGAACQDREEPKRKDYTGGNSPQQQQEQQQELLVSVNSGSGGLIRTALPCVAVGASSGFIAACMVLPFDFVRRSLLPGLSTMAYLRASLSTVPYSGALFGVYFGGRDPKGGIRSQGPWALAAALTAVAAEAPFDKVHIASFER